MCDPQNFCLKAVGSIPGPFAHSEINHNKRTFNLLRSFYANSSVFLLVIILFLEILYISPTDAGLVLSDHIRHFEPVFFNQDLLRSHHRRAKRDTSHTISLDFSAHNRNFKIRLKRDAGVFADDVIFENTDGLIHFDRDKVYSGTLEDDDQVEVHGVITKEGLFDGHVTTPNDLFYIEPAHRYLETDDFHTVMYKSSDVLHPRPARCASEQLRLRGRVQSPWVSPSPSEESSSGALFEPLGLPVIRKSNEESAFHPQPPYSAPIPIISKSVHPKLKAVNYGSLKPTRSLNTLPRSSEWSSREQDLLGVGNGSLFNSQNKRKSLLLKSKRSIIDPKKTTCMLYLQADHLFFKEEGSEEACIDKITRHVQRVNNIYKITDFDRDGKEDGIGFMIKRIKIHSRNATDDPTYRFPGNYGVEKFLELFSEEDYDAFCLAYMFTYRDFEGGTLGLAWTGDLKNAGGVCEKNGHYRGSLKSLNTGIVTLLNYGKKVPPAVSHVTLAHEIGHNFGSPHDPEKDMNCTPGGENGNYIMFARATSGDKKNNNRFSPCSLRQIDGVLKLKARDTKGCFTEPQSAICGNGVVEAGEECDCGWQEDCDESCCFPMLANPPRGHKPCSLRPAKICSPSQGPCCTKECRLKQGDLCREDNGCRDASFCDGSGPYCPPSINKPNKTICKDEFVCFKGECTGSICIAYGLDSCQCARQSGDPETKSCELCCKLPGQDQPCLSSFEWNVAPLNIPDMYAKPGTPCDNYKGYCDVFQKCREVDPSGPLATLRKLLLSNESLANLQRLIVDYWYVVFVFIVALIVILVAVGRVMGKQSLIQASKRRKKKKRKSSSDPSKKSHKQKSKHKTIVHKNNIESGHLLSVPSNGNLEPQESAAHVVHPTVVRANIPFKRKVNEVKRAATKAKRAARSQLGKPCKKASTSKRSEHLNGELGEHSSDQVNTPGESSAAVKNKEKNTSSRFSIISFKPFRPKPISPDKLKIKSFDKRKSVDKRSKTKTTKGRRSRSPEKRRKSLPDPTSTEGNNDKSKAKSLSKRLTLEDEKKKFKLKSSSLEKPAKAIIIDISKKNKSKTAPSNIKLEDGNWLIRKFLADEEKLTKPVLNGSLAGSLSSVSNATNISPLNGSPNINHSRTGSTRALLPTPMINNYPVNGVINEAFVASPRNGRIHSSLRITKSPNLMDAKISASKYRRSISAGANANQKPPFHDKRKRLTKPEEASPGKRRRFSSPEKPLSRTSCSFQGTKDKKKSTVSKRTGKTSFSGNSFRLKRRNSCTLPSSSTQGSKSCSSVPDKLKEKLTLITASPEGSVTSIIMPDMDNAETRKNQPKNWV